MAIPGLDLQKNNILNMHYNQEYSLVVTLFSVSHQIYKTEKICNILQANALGSQGTLTSGKSLSHCTKSEDEHSFKDGETVKDCNGRLVPHLIIRAPTMTEVSPV